MINRRSPQKPDWMVVYVTYHIHEAQILVGRLQAEDIQAILYQEPGASAIGIHIGKLGEIKVLVRPEDYDIALDILFPDEPDALPDNTDPVIFPNDEPTDEQ